MPGIGHNGLRGGSTYAIVLDLDTNGLKEVYPGPSRNNAHDEVGAFLGRHGFGWQQGSTYFSDETVNEVSCVLTIQDLTEAFDWFAPSVRDIRMLRIESNNDLMPAVERASKRRSGRVRQGRQPFFGECRRPVGSFAGQSRSGVFASCDDLDGVTGYDLTTATASGRVRP